MCGCGVWVWEGALSHNQAKFPSFDPWPGAPRVVRSPLMGNAAPKASASPPAQASSTDRGYSPPAMPPGKPNTTASASSSPKSDGPKMTPAEEADARLALRHDRSMMKEMLFPTSGRLGFERIAWPTATAGPYPLLRDEVVRLLRVERDTRLSPACQARYDAAVEAQDLVAFSSVTTWAQHRALEACGYEVSELSVLMLRSALDQFADVRAHTHPHTHTYIHTHTYTYTYTCTYTSTYVST